MSLPTSVVCETQEPCCFPAPVFYGQGRTFLSAQTGFVLECPQGYNCDAGAYPHNIIIPGGRIPFIPNEGANPLRFTCCDGVELVQYLPDGFTQQQFDTAAQEIADDAAQHLAGCEAAAYNAQHAKKRTQCLITTDSTLPEAPIGIPYSVTLTQSGDSGTVTWSVFSGSLPTGLTLDSSGTISGTPTVSGLSTFVVQATGEGGSCKRVFRLTVSSDVPCDLGLSDNTDFGDRSINTFDSTATTQWTSIPVGTYTVQYISGGVASNNPLIGSSPSVPWLVNPQVFSGPENSNAQLITEGTTRRPLPWTICAFDTLSNLEANFDTTTLGCSTDSFQPPKGRTVQFQSLESTISIDVHTTYTTISVSPVVWRLTRIKKTAIDYDIQLRIADLASVLASLTPFDSCTAGAGTVWDGTFPVFEPNFNYVNYEYRIDDGSGQFQLNSTLLDTPAAVKVYHDTAGQATPTGCAWILAITYVHPVQGNVVSWVGLGGAGYSPEGTYVFSSDVVGWTMFGKKTAVRVATTTALPANTRVLNVLTADANGALPAIDGVTLALNDRVLVKDEALGANRGVYTVTSLGSGITPWILTRSTDLDTSGEMLRGIFMPVTGGTVNVGKHFRLVTNGPITLNTTSLSFTAITDTITVEQF